LGSFKGTKGLSDSMTDFRSSLDTIERAYEIMLAYAAQGRDTDMGQTTAPSIRDTLVSLNDALGVVVDQVSDAYSDDSNAGFVDTLREDANRASCSVQAALNCARISSQLIDNLNASIHLRAVLTGLFLADEALKIQSAPSA
jgi:hypothetical protein